MEHVYLTCAIPMYKRWLVVGDVRGTTKAAPDDKKAVASIGKTAAKKTAKKFVLIVVSCDLKCKWLSGKDYAFENGSLSLYFDRNTSHVVCCLVVQFGCMFCSGTRLVFLRF